LENEVHGLWDEYHQQPQALSVTDILIVIGNLGLEIVAELPDSRFLI
jgi:hypothetical protein